MDVEWRNATWGDLATLEYGRALRGHESNRGPYRVYGTNGPIGWYSEALYEHPSVIVGRKGAYRGIHYAPKPFFVIDTAFYLLPRAKIDMRWAYYELLTHDINGLDSGSAIPSTTREAFYALPVRWPPLDEQRAIARVLGALDDKIDLNRRMNETLEALAQLRFSTLIGSPDAARWPVRCLADVASLTKGVSYRSTDLVGGADTALVTLKSVRRGGGYQSDGLKPYLGPYKPQQQVSPGDVVVAQTDVTQAADVIGRTARVGHEPAFSVLVASLDLIVVRALGDISREFLYLLLSGDDFHDYAVSYTNGTTVLHLDASALRTYPLALPPATEMRALTASVAPLLARMDAAVAESRTLRSIRDALLPRLIAGEIRVSQAERLLEAAPV
jgi:type I restriction enzyme S subunit